LRNLPPLLFLCLFFASRLQAGIDIGRTQSAAVLSSDGSPLAFSLSGGGALREYAGLDDISPWMVLASLAAEDKRFFSHPGFDPAAAARAALQNISRGRTVSGASTITQQLSRKLKPHRRGLLGKIEEIFSAVELERDNSKEAILEAYLNVAPYGNNIEGVQAASVGYFGVPASGLSLSQAAALAAIPKSPSFYGPFKKNGALEKRRVYILSKMLKLGYVDSENYRLAMSEKPFFRRPGNPFYAPQFAQYAVSHSPSQVIYSTVDSELQKALASALKNRISLLKLNNVTNGAAVVLDNTDGKILAWVGSADFFDREHGGQIDGVTVLRQPGSALKPFLYYLALVGGATAADLISDAPLYSAGGYTPMNYDRRNHGVVRLRTALACSYNIPAVRTAEKVGVPVFLDLLRRLGFVSLTRDASYYGAGLALGDGEVSLLELAGAYSALARGGIYMEPVFEKGKRGTARRVAKEEESFIITSILSDNQARAAAFGLNSPLSLPFDFAAKTGTSKDYRDNWAVGYTPEWTIAVWVGNFNGSPMRQVSGISGAAPVLRDAAFIMKKLYGSTPFEKPDGVVRTEICQDTGYADVSGCGNTVAEYFTKSSPARRREKSSGKDKTAVKPKINFPQDGDIFRIDPSYPAAAQAIVFRTADKLPDRPLWYVDGKEIKDGSPWLLLKGRHSVYCEVGGEKSDKINFRVVN